MNKCGTPTNLRSAHFGNGNALKAGVYSAAVREEKARVLERKLASIPPFRVFYEIRLHELASMLSLRDLLEADLAVNGISNRRGEPRRQLDLLLRVDRQLGKWLDRIEREAMVSRNRESEAKSELQRELSEETEQWEEMRRIAHGESAYATLAQQIRALDLVLSRPRPRPANPLDAFSNDEVEKAWDAIKRGEEAAIDLSVLDVSPIESNEQVRERCLQELHAIVTGRCALPVGDAARISAYKVHKRHAPERRDLVAEELDAMSDDQLDDELRQLGIDPVTLEPPGASSEEPESDIAA
jgi:hypothetical protein